MKKLLALIITIMMVFALAGCSNTGSNTENEKKTQSNEVNSKTGDKETDNQSVGDNGKTNKDNTNKHILVAYFSYSGNTKVIANKIHENVGGDIFEIKTVDPYPTDYNTVVKQAKKEQEENYRPKLATKVDNIDSYGYTYGNALGNDYRWSTKDDGNYRYKPYSCNHSTYSCGDDCCLLS